jgi:hypothetical protein
LANGCATKSEEFKTKFDQSNTYVENMYEMRSTIAFLQGKLRGIRNHLLSHNDLRHLMLWVIILVAVKLCLQVIILVGVKLCLRIDEALDLKYEQFLRA